MGASMDKPAAALLKDLKAPRPARRHHRDLDDGVWPHAVQPGRQGPRPQPVCLHLLAGRRRHQGRRHVTAPATSGPTRPSRIPTYCYDLHATILHLLGIDHEKLTFRHNGIDRRLTDVHGHVIEEILA